jgi:hypothetical protein
MRITGRRGLFREEWSQTQSVLTFNRFATSSAVRSDSTSGDVRSGFRENACVFIGDSMCTSAGLIIRSVVIGFVDRIRTPGWMLVEAIERNSISLYLLQPRPFRRNCPILPGNSSRAFIYRYSREDPKRWGTPKCPIDSKKSSLKIYFERLISTGVRGDFVLDLD